MAQVEINSAAYKASTYSDGNAWTNVRICTRVWRVTLQFLLNPANTI